MILLEVLLNLRSSDKDIYRILTIYGTLTIKEIQKKLGSEIKFNPPHKIRSSLGRLYRLGLIRPFNYFETGSKLKIKWMIGNDPNSCAKLHKGFVVEDVPVKPNWELMKAIG